MPPPRTLAQLLHDYLSADTNDRDDHCFAITPMLIAGGLLSPTQEQMVDELDQAFGIAAPIGREMVLYRGCAPAEIQDSIPYSSFLSTSSDLLEALRFSRGCLIRFEIPAETRILRVSPQDGSVATLEQNEYLLGRNMTFNLGQWVPDEDESSKLLFNLNDLQLIKLQAVIA